MRGLPDVAPELFAGVLCVLVIGAFFLGRWSVSTTVRAAEGTPVTTEVDETLSMDVTDRTPTMDGEEPAPWVEPEPTALTVQLPGTVGMLEANSQAFEDMENRRTVRVESYINNEAGRREALSEGVYLSSLGFPAMLPVVLGDNIYLCVGAAPSVKDEELLRIMRELRQIPGPPPASEHKKYADSYLYNIDDVGGGSIDVSSFFMQEDPSEE